MKILVVDDERMICEWLQFCIQNNPGCELVGCAHNGEQALALFKQTEVDVVFTDIKMPVMGGLELLKRIKELSPKTIVVMLTAFAEFDLAREAIRQGGDDYLLKTEMNNQTFHEVLDRLEKQLSENGSHGRGETESTGQQHSIVSEILKGSETLGEGEIRKLRDCHIRWRDDGLFAVAVWKQELLKGFMLPENSMIHHVVGIEYDRRTYVVVGNLVRNLSELKKIRLLHDYVAAIVAKNQCMAGVSTITDNLSHVTSVIAEAVCGLNCGYYSGKIKAWGSPVPGAKVTMVCEQWEEFFRKKRRELYELEGSAFYRILEDVMEMAEAEGTVPVQELMSFCCEAMEMACVRFGHEDARLMYHMMAEIKKEALQSPDFHDIREKILDFVKNMLSDQDIDEKKLSKGVAAAVDYVRKHYSESISLEQVSLEVHLNSEYLSRIFKEEVGCTYSAFLSETRLKTAAYLLSHTSERVKTIAEQVGYPNVSYFSTTFKKRYGVNPYEYRRGE